MVLHASRWATTSSVLFLSVVSLAGAFLPRVRIPVISTASPSPVPRSLEPDFSAPRFSLHIAYFLSEMSNLVYKKRREVERVLKGQLGYSHFSWFEFKSAVSDKSLFDGVEDTEGFVAANDDVILLVFRGTSSLGDFVTDFKINLIPAPSRWGVKGSLHKVATTLNTPYRLGCVAWTWGQESTVQDVRAAASRGEQQSRSIPRSGFSKPPIHLLL